MQRPAVSTIVWSNVCRLLEAAGHGAAPGIDAVHKALRNRVGRGQLQRLAEGGNVTLKTLDLLAQALGVPAWQLLRPADSAAHEPRAAYQVVRPGALVDAITELVARLPRDQRTPAADLIAPWVRTGDDDGRSSALLSILQGKQQAAA